MDRNYIPRTGAPRALRYALATLALFGFLIAPARLDSQPAGNLEQEFDEQFDATPGSNESDRYEDAGEQRSDEDWPRGTPTGNLLNFVDRNQRTYALDILAAVDMVGAWDNEEPHTTGNEFQVREVEVGFLADIDQWAQGVLLMAAHQESGETVFELHEAYFAFPRFFLPNLSARVGEMFFDVGRLNSTHRHDWKFTNAPLVHEQLLDEEAAGDSGAELSLLFPWPFWQELTVGVFNGKTFGHSHVEGPTKNNPLYTAHLKQFFALGESWGTQFGFSYLRWHPTEEPHKVTHQYGFDGLLKWTRGHLGSFELSAELWYRETREKNRRRFDPPAEPVDTRVGGYIFSEYRFHPEWGVGYRYDLFTNPNYIDEQGNKQSRNGTEAHALMVTFYASEFSYFRATGERATTLQTGDNTYQFYLQADFILGKHPPHNY